MYSEAWHNEQVLVLTQIQPDSDKVKATDFKVDVQYHVHIEWKKSCVVKSLVEKENHEGFTSLI